jgi:hypothetical protein
LLLVGLNLASWPLLYLLLQSYVPEWPGVMCIFGVTQVGTGSQGPARHLPILLSLLQISKPALVFAGGAWFTLYLINRRTHTGPLLGRLFLLLLPLGAVAVVDAAAELAYIGIPKQEEFPPVGCCTVEPEQDGRFLPQALFEEDARPWLAAAYYATNLGMLFALLRVMARRSVPGSMTMASLLLGGVATLGAGYAFLVDVAAPTLLGLPDHHCAYDLIPQVPEAVVTIAIAIVASFALGWACVARWLGKCADTEQFLPDFARCLLMISFLSYAASLLMASLEMLLA